MDSGQVAAHVHVWREQISRSEALRAAAAHRANQQDTQPAPTRGSEILFVYANTTVSQPEQVCAAPLSLSPLSSAPASLPIPRCSSARAPHLARRLRAHSMREVMPRFCLGRKPSPSLSMVSRLARLRSVFCFSSSRVSGRSSSSSSSDPSSESNSSPAVGGTTSTLPPPSGTAGPCPRIEASEVCTSWLATSCPDICIWTAAYIWRISLVRCSMTPRYCIILLSVTPWLPSTALTAAALHPILSNVIWMPCFRWFTVAIVLSARCWYWSAFASVFASFSSRSCRMRFRWLSVLSPRPLYFSISRRVSAICSSSFSTSLLSSLT
mmetsp:Transcript_41234/g.97865  ORF Transcript_41234/g.97865 Transcript_41234/m.97865 type:complete len:324 (-) Transcript_41234:439-1410(-)